MFGRNPVEHQQLGDGSALRIVKGSPWLTIQGEGPYAGTPAVFLRLHGCNLRCTFCDTNFSDDKDPFISTDLLVSAVAEVRGPARLVVITGGEPLLQNIVPLCQDIMDFNEMVVQIETAGTVWIPGFPRSVDIVCSPKTPTIHPAVYEVARAFKYVISVDQELDGYIPVTSTQPGARNVKLAMPRPGADVYLSPMDQWDKSKNEANRSLVARLAMKHGVMAGLQMHKHFGVD